MNNPPLATHSAATILDRMEEELTQAGSAASALWPSIKAEAKAVPAQRYEHIVVTGCGDSYYAGLAMRVALEELSGLPVAVMPSMEAATFPSRLLEGDALMFAVSVSGKVERTIEAVVRHRERGGTAVAITAFPDNQLSSAAHSVVSSGLRGTPGPVPGTANYLGSLLALLAVGLEMEARDGRPCSIADSAVLAAIGKISGVVVDSMRESPALARPLTTPFFALGSGPDLGAMSFGVAKFVEAAATVGVAQDLEEWAHEQYFATGEGTTAFICSTSPATDERALRVARSVAAVGGVPVTIGVDSDAPRAVNLNLPKTPTMLTPLIAWVPLAVVALAYARTHNSWPFGIDRPNRMSTVDSDIYVMSTNSDGD